MNTSCLLAVVFMTIPQSLHVPVLFLQKCYIPIQLAYSALFVCMCEYWRCFMEDVAWRNERSIFKVMPQHRVNIGILFDIAITKKGISRGWKPVCYTALILSSTDTYFLAILRWANLMRETDMKDGPWEGAVRKSHKKKVYCSPQEPLSIWFHFFSYKICLFLME